MTRALLLLLAFGFLLEAQPAGRDDVFRRALQAPGDPKAFSALLAALPKDDDYYVVEGDLLLTDDEVKAYLYGLSGSPRSAKPGPELILNYVGGNPDYWSDPTKRDLKYWIDKDSFATEADYATVRKNLAAAAANWVSACPGCRVSFAEVDTPRKPSRNERRFVVRRVKSGSYIAAAFFPSYTDKRLVLNVDQSYFGTTFDKIGVFRHEMGHMLGYRHEHIQNIPGCWQEGGTWKPLSPYDPHSVMHYFCGGGGTMQLALSPVDIDSHRKAYAVP